MTRPRLCLPALILAFLTAQACTPPPVRRDDPPPRAAPAAPLVDEAPSRPDDAPAADEAAASDQEIAVFRDYVYAYYDYALFEREPKTPPDPAAREQRLTALKRAQAIAGRRLTRILGLADGAAAGAIVARMRGRIGRRSDVEVLPDIWGAPVASVCVVQLRAGGSRRGQVTLFGEERATDVRVFDAVLVEDFVSYRRRINKEASVFQGVLVAGPVFYVDGRAVASLARAGFWDRLGYYREVARQARGAEGFLALEGRPEKLLALAKDALRWRALSFLVHGTESRPDSVKVERFAEDFTARAELRAAAELRELELFQAKLGRGPRSLAERKRVAERAQLSAIIHGEPLGAVADVFGLALRGRAEGKRAEPSARAAANLASALLVRVRGPGPAGKGDEARALFKICRAEPGELRALARAIYRERLSE